MAEITSNAAEIAERYRARYASWSMAVRTGVRRAMVAVERAAVKRLSGTGAPWTYPVPVRTGFLRRSMFAQQPSDVMAVVGNTAGYASAIHDGYVSEWAGRGKHRMRMKAEPRPFLDDAVKDADPGAIVHTALAVSLEMAV